MGSVYGIQLVVSMLTFCLAGTPVNTFFILLLARAAAPIANIITNPTAMVTTGRCLWSLCSDAGWCDGLLFCLTGCFAGIGAICYLL